VGVFEDRNRYLFRTIPSKENIWKDSTKITYIAVCN
jgi:hypothetical protein